MTRIWNPYTFTPLGNPIVGEAPPVLRVMGGMQATAQQLSYAQQRFTQFVMQARLSAVPNPTEAGRLPDGTQYRIVVVGQQTVMEIWPAAGDGDGVGPFIAWTAFVTSSYLPIWDRPLVDFPYDDLPPKPLPPGPEPEYPQLASSGQTTGADNPAPYTTRKWVTSAASAGDTILYEATVEGTLVSTPLDELSSYTNFVITNYPFSRLVSYDPIENISIYDIHTLSVSFTGTPDGIFGPHNGGDPTDPLPNVWHYTPESGEGPTKIYLTFANTGIVAAAGAAAANYNRSAIASWEVAHAAWAAQYGQYLIDLAEWEEARDELIALQRPWWPVNDARKGARPGQVAAVKPYLQGGIGDRHLTARILSFPYNVAYRTIPPAGAGGSIVNDAVTTDTLLGFKSDLLDAEPFTTIPRWDDGLNEMYPERTLRVDFMPPECLFGWKASGSIQYGYRYHMENPRSEHYVLMPPGLDDVSVSQLPDYFTNTYIRPDTAVGLVVAADAFVPVGSTVTVVFFEYRVADPYTGEIYWTECPDLMQHDSIWIRDTGTYIDTPRAVDPLFTSRVRLAGAITQRRTAWGTWSAPVTTPIVQGGWEAAYVTAVEYARPANAPTAVVLASNLHPGANPGPVQSGGFPFGAKFLWSGAPDPVRAAKSRAWDASGATANQEQFIARALIAAGRIKP